MRILLDTNVLVAAFAAHGSCGELLEHCTRNHRVFTSPFILSEFRRALIKKLRFTLHEAGSAARLLESRFEIITPPAVRRICHDPDDDHIIAAAVAASCDCIVTGDRDLLDIKQIEGVRIISPSEFWENETQ